MTTLDIPNPKSPSTQERVMVVGDQRVFDQLAPQFDRQSVVSSDLFEAVGKLTLAPDKNPITTVLLSLSATNQPAGKISGALRRIDPSVRLVALADKTDEQLALDAVESGFDSFLLLPAESDQIVRACGFTLTAASDEPLASADTQSEAEPDGPLIFGEINQPAETMAFHPKGIDDSVADIELIDRVLEGAAPLAEAAVRLLRRQSGSDDIEFIEHVRTGQENQDLVEVAVNGRRYGVLQSGTLSRAQLEQWATWLAHWLALEESHRRLWRMAYTDDLTSAWNRRFFDRFLAHHLAQAKDQQRTVTLMVFDIDNFKQYNDQFGHDAGDEVLRETVRLLNSVIRRGDRVCRIGGDEFVVIFSDPEGPRESGSTPASVEQIATRFQDQICNTRFSALGVEGPGTLSISGGLATFPWDGRDARSLLRHADQLALQSKRKGKNLITFGPGAKRLCESKPQC